VDFTLLVLNDARLPGAFEALLQFMRSTLEQGRKIRQVFFYSEAVRVFDVGVNENVLLRMRELIALANQHHFSILACNTAIQRRGLDNLPVMHDRPMRGSLGQFVVACIGAEVVEFVD
jgi:sulfur relay (sulfurtransferase) complex TusBCD TusD component (DsrE family)